MRKTGIFSLLLLLLNSFWSMAQNPQTDKSGIRIMFYNVENLFHPSDDSLKNDDEFTETGTRHWSFARYYDKLSKIGKTAIAVGAWQPPAVIGLCEVEDRQCLEDLVYSSPLKEFGYEIIHQESADNRGIDVAMLYRPEFFSLILWHSYTLRFTDGRPSRDILYAKGIVGTDTLHLFVNHWPSRYGGQQATEHKRQFAAETLRHKYDSLLALDPAANIIAMGDFNDHPDDPSMFEILRAKKDTLDLQPGDLLNLVWQYEFVKGTHKFQHEWGILDQFVATPLLISGGSRLYTSFDRVGIFDAAFLLEDENDGIGQTTNRTYAGFSYHGGYSDHLPIYMDVLIRQD